MFCALLISGRRKVRAVGGFRASDLVLFERSTVQSPLMGLRVPIENVRPCLERRTASEVNVVLYPSSQN
jgi:hypothetical protein